MSKAPEQNKPCALSSLQAEATAALTAFSMAAAEANRLPTHERIAAYRALPVRVASRGAVSVKAIVPQNRAVWRRQHIRFQYRIAGRLVSEAEARAALHQ